MLILYDFTFGRWRKNYKLWSVFLLPILLKFLLPGALGVRQRVMQVGFTAGQPSLSNPIFNLAYSFFSHLGLLVWPLKLTLYHEPNIISSLALGLEICLLAGLFLSLPFIFRKARPIFFALGFFMLFLLPTYSPVTVSWLVAERYLYFSSLALSMVFAFAVDKYAQESRAKKLANLLLVFLLAFYSWRTIARNADWKTFASIWRATLAVSPLSPRAHNNMGDVYFREGNLQQAAEEFIRAIELQPDYAEAYHNLANTYQQMGKIDEAIINYQKAVSLNPSLYQSYQNLGVIYLNKGRSDTAKEYFRRVLEVKPDNAAVGEALRKLENAANNK